MRARYFYTLLNPDLKCKHANRSVFCLYLDSTLRELWRAIPHFDAIDSNTSTHYDFAVHHVPWSVDSLLYSLVVELHLAADKESVPAASLALRNELYFFVESIVSYSDLIEPLFDRAVQLELEFGCASTLSLTSFKSASYIEYLLKGKRNGQHHFSYFELLCLALLCGIAERLHLVDYHGKRASPLVSDTIISPLDPLSEYQFECSSSSSSSIGSIVWPQSLPDSRHCEFYICTLCIDSPAVDVCALDSRRIFCPLRILEKRTIGAHKPIGLMSETFESLREHSTLIIGAARKFKAAVKNNTSNETRATSHST